MQKTVAWPLSLIYAALVVYASLYPFTGWRDQGVAPLAFLPSPLPQYWTGFDVGANMAGYIPLGFLLALSALRRGARGAGRRAALTVAFLSCASLSLLLEVLQNYLPSRVPSNVDWTLNMLGGLAGAAVAIWLETRGTIDRWSRFRARWFAADARGALVLLALWPAALLFPAAVAFGLGQVMERLETALATWLDDTPFLEWLPMREIELQPLVPAVELVCVMLGLLVPCLLGFAIIRSAARRAVFLLAVLAAGTGASALSSALSFGPAHAWAWFSLPVQVGVTATLVLCIILLPLPRRGCTALMLLALVVHLSLLNQAPASAYFAQTLQTWEQGRFIRFNGLVQWLGWLWPYAALAYAVLQLSQREPKN